MGAIGGILMSTQLYEKYQSRYKYLQNKRESLILMTSVCKLYFLITIYLFLREVSV